MDSKPPVNSGQQDLHSLIASLDPVLDSRSYVFCLLGDDEAAGQVVRSKHVWAIIRESEGTTFILTKSEADRLGYTYDGVWRKITCMVHSSLEAVGMTALLSSTLAEHEISANVVAAFTHDHLFVPAERADDALKLLIGIQKRAQ